MRTTATTVEDYLDSLPEDRRAALEQVRAVILKRLPKGYVETINWGMISYEIPLETYPKTYNKQPLMYAALASQKHYMAVYLSTIAVSEESAKAFEREYRATGKRYDVGKSCIRFRKLEDLPLDLIGRVVKATPPRAFIAMTEAARAGR